MVVEACASPGLEALAPDNPPDEVTSVRLSGRSLERADAGTARLVLIQGRRMVAL
jgi:hypothetical protein